MKTLREELNLTQRDVSERLGISPSAIIRYEQYIYERLSPNIAQFYADELGVPVDDIHKQYVAARYAAQEEAQKFFKTSLPFLTIKPYEHPFVTFRKQITQGAVGKDSQVSFCILFKVHPSVLASYETGKQRSMPNLLKNALRGMPREYFRRLNEFGEIWYDRRGHRL